MVAILASLLNACSGTGDTSNNTDKPVSGIDVTAPSKPENIRTTSLLPTVVQLSWDAATDNIQVSGYRVYKNSVFLVETAATGFMDNSVVANTAYQYTVSVFDTSGNTTMSDPLSITTPALADIVAPSAPGNFRSTAITSSSITFAWNASTDNTGVAGYRVYRGTTLATTTTALTFTNSSLTAATLYQYRVEAFDAAGNYAASNIISVTTLSGTDATAPSVPTGLAVTSNTSSSIVLTWNAATDNVAVTRYYIYRNSISIANTTTRSYADNTVVASTSYQYTVTAADAAGNTSAQSVALSVTTASGNYGVPYTDANFDAMMGTTQVYMSPTGATTGDCSTQQTACRTFAYAISQMAPGDGLILMDGNYSLAVNGGPRATDENSNSISLSANLPSGVSVDVPTVMRALTPGNVFIEGGFTLGNKTQKTQFVVIYGLTFFTPGNFRNADFSVVKASGIYGRLSVGSIDHSMGCSYNLIEDVWIWGKNQRGNAVNYSAHHNIWRRVLIRDDGCDALYCGEIAGRLKISSTIYNSHDVTFENMISMDKILRANTYGTGSYADFATAQHASYRATLPPEGEQNGRNSWLGSMAINSEDYTINFEAGEVLPLPVTTGTIRDFVALNTRAGATIDGAGCPYNSASKYDINNVYLYSVAGNAIYSGCNSNYVLGSNINTGSYTNNMATGRVPQYQYGTTTSLWPWPYELRIRNDICVRGRYNNGVNAGDEFPDTGIRATKNFCSYNGSLSNYINSF